MRILANCPDATNPSALMARYFGRVQRALGPERYHAIAQASHQMTHEAIAERLLSYGSRS